jgi:hypothetical protein
VSSSSGPLRCSGACLPVMDFVSPDCRLPLPVATGQQYRKFSQTVTELQSGPCPIAATPNSTSAIPATLSYPRTYGWVHPHTLIGLQSHASSLKLDSSATMLSVIVQFPCHQRCWLLGYGNHVGGKCPENRKHFHKSPLAQLYFWNLLDPNKRRRQSKSYFDCFYLS